jgi:hypothetical protein
VHINGEGSKDTYHVRACTRPARCHVRIRIRQNKSRVCRIRYRDDSRSGSVGYPQVSGPAGLGLGMVFHPRFTVSVSGLVSGSVLGLVFHPWISNGYPK